MLPIISKILFTFVFILKVHCNTSQISSGSCVSINDESLLIFVKYNNTVMSKSFCGEIYCANYMYSVVHNGSYCYCVNTCNQAVFTFQSNNTILENLCNTPCSATKYQCGNNLQSPKYFGININNIVCTTIAPTTATSTTIIRIKSNLSSYASSVNTISQTVSQKYSYLSNGASNSTSSATSIMSRKTYAENCYILFQNSTLIKKMACEELKTPEIIIKVSKQIDATRDRLLKEIDDKKQKELKKLRQKYASYDRAKGPTTYIAVICVLVVAFYITIMDTFRIRAFCKPIIIRLFGRNKVSHFQLDQKRNQLSNQERKRLNDLDNELYLCALKSKKMRMQNTKRIKKK